MRAGTRTRIEGSPTHLPVSRGFVCTLVGAALTVGSWFSPWAWPAWPALAAIDLLTLASITYADMSGLGRAAVVVGLITINILVWGVCAFLLSRLTASFRLRRDESG